MESSVTDAENKPEDLVFEHLVSVLLQERRLADPDTVYDNLDPFVSDWSDDSVDLTRNVVDQIWQRLEQERLAEDTEDAPQGVNGRRNDSNASWKSQFSQDLLSASGPSAVGGKKVSLEHHFTKRLQRGPAAPSLVNAEKLAKYEAKVKAKMEKRKAMAEGALAAGTKDSEAKGGQVTEDEEAAQFMQRLLHDSDGDYGIGLRDIKIENFDIGYASKPILNSANLSLVYGRRYGLVGRNGEGKSTLLRAISSRELDVPRHLSILHVEQEAAGSEITAIESVLEADRFRNFLKRKEAEANAILAPGSGASPEDTAKWQNILKRVYKCNEDIEADKAESR